MQVEAAKQAGTDVEVMCSQFEVICPVVEVDSVPEVTGPAVKVNGSAVEVMEVLSLEESRGSVNELRDPPVHVSP